MDELEKYINLPYRVEVVPEQSTDGEPCYIASHPELPGCMSHADTPDEAIENLADARKLYLETLLEKNESIPVPSTIGTSSSSFSQTVIWRVLPTSITHEDEITDQDALQCRAKIPQVLSIQSL